MIEHNPFNPLSAKPTKRSNTPNSSSKASEFLECVWPFCGVGTYRVKAVQYTTFKYYLSLKKQDNMLFSDSRKYRLQGSFYLSPLSITERKMIDHFYTNNDEYMMLFLNWASRMSSVKHVRYHMQCFLLKIFFSLWGVLIKLGNELFVRLQFHWIKMYVLSPRKTNSSTVTF